MLTVLVYTMLEVTAMSPVSTTLSTKADLVNKLLSNFTLLLKKRNTWKEISERELALTALSEFILKLCLNDIESAFDSGYPADMTYKLILRKGQCLAQLGQWEEAKAGQVSLLGLIIIAIVLSKLSDHNCLIIIVIVWL